MKAYEIQGSFGIENLQIVERPTPEVGAGEVRLELSAASLNYRDLLTVKGHYNPRQPLPLIPGSDAVGVVAEVGPGVSRVRPGDRVMPAFNPSWVGGEFNRELRNGTLGGPLDGSFASELVVPATGVVAVPEYLSDEQASTLPCAAVTAWSALVEEGGLRAGDTVLLQGTGGVSLFGLQIAKAAGARVMITSSSDEKLARAEELGADATHNYARDPKWDKAAMAWTGGRGVDHVVEVGGAGTLSRSLKAVRLGGRISVIGVLDGVKGEVDVIPILMGRVRLQGIMVGSRQTFEALLRGMEARELEPVVDVVFPFEELPEALRHMEAGKHFGKIVVALR